MPAEDTHEQVSISLALMLALGSEGETMRRKTRSSGLVLALLFLVSGCSVTYPKPDGPYAVGTTVIALEDLQRAEVYESPPGRRSVVLQVWYPTEVATGTRDLYINRPLANALEKWMGIPAFLLGEPQASSSFLGAPISTDRERFPIVLFNHGYGSFATQNYTQMENLASHGFVAISLSHPYTSLLTQFPDGRNLERAANAYWASLPELAKNLDAAGLRFKDYVDGIRNVETATQKLRGLQDLTQSEFYRLLEDDFGTWVSDSLFVLQQLPELNDSNPMLGHRMDVERVGIYGHSFGGAVATQVALEAPSLVRAGLNLDGPQLIYHAESPTSLQVPFAFVYSTDTRIGNVTCDQSGLNDGFFLSASAPVYRRTVQGASHENFSDLTYIDALKGNPLLGSIDNRAVGKLTSLLVVDYFAHYLQNGPEVNLLPLEGKKNR
jgi:pimeloyl-ACP methyl ester carboxylesterase